jgi:hypothetical protein
MNIQNPREVVDIVLDRVIQTLRADCRMPKLTHSEWEMFFARAGASVAEDLDWLDERLSSLENRLNGAHDTISAIGDLIAAADDADEE